MRNGIRELVLLPEELSPRIALIFKSSIHIIGTSGPRKSKRVTSEPVILQRTKRHENGANELTNERMNRADESPIKYIHFPILYLCVPARK